MLSSNSLNVKFLAIIICVSIFLGSCSRATPPPTPTPLPTATAIPPTITPVPTQASRTNNSTNLYAGPSDVFDILGALDPGATLQILGIDPTGEWAKVKVIDSSKNGWLPLKDITLNADLPSFPVDYNIPSTPIPPAACFNDCASIEITNDTGGLLSISVTGIVDGKWSVVVGTRTIDLKPGSYTVTALASCGTKTDIVILTVGMSQKFSYFCQTVPH